MTYILTNENRRAIVNRSTGLGQTQVMQADLRYFATDPETLAEKLRASGCFGNVTVEEVGRRKTRGWRHIVVAREPEWVGTTGRPEYLGNVSVLLDHTGKQADKIRPGAVRLACENQFVGAPIAMHHCRDEIRDFWLDPIPYLRAAIATGSRQIMNDLESLRGIGAAQDMLEVVTKASSRLGKKLYSATLDSPGACDFYQILQGCTRSRSPGLSLAATDVLTVGLAQAKQGIVPDCWNARFLAREKPELVGSVLSQNN
jgi:hypothetical protein